MSHSSETPRASPSRGKRSHSDTVSVDDDGAIVISDDDSAQANDQGTSPTKKICPSKPVVQPVVLLYDYNNRTGKSSPVPALAPPHAPAAASAEPTSANFPAVQVKPEPLSTPTASPMVGHSPVEDSTKIEEASALAAPASGATIAPNSASETPSEAHSDTLFEADSEASHSGRELVPYDPQAQPRIPGRPYVRVDRKKECAKSFLKCAAWTAFATSLGAAAVTAGAAYMGHIDIQPFMVEAAKFFSERLPTMIPTAEFASNAATACFGSSICSNLTAGNLTTPSVQEQSFVRNPFLQDCMGPAL